MFVNNAGLLKSGFIIEGETTDFKAVFDLNILASCVCVREAVKDMRERNAMGHIIVLNR